MKKKIKSSSEKGLKYYWPTVLKTYFNNTKKLEEIRAILPNFATQNWYNLAGKIYPPLENETIVESQEREQRFYKNLYDDIVEKIGFDEFRRLNPAGNETFTIGKLKDYHEAASNGDDSHRNPANFDILQQYIKDTLTDPKPKPIIDWKAFWLSLLLLTMTGFAIWQGRQINKLDSLSNLTYVVGLQSQIKQLQEPLKDKYIIHIQANDNSESSKLNSLAGTWYSYNKTDVLKDSLKNTPYCKIKWNFEMNGPKKRMEITREYNAEKKTSTLALGIAEYKNNAYAFYLNTDVTHI
jgi:hypothetical protein